MKTMHTIQTSRTFNDNIDNLLGVQITALLLSPIDGHISICVRHSMLSTHNSTPCWKDHTQDSDCSVDPETLSCALCGVDHSGECLDCGGRGFHKPTCESQKHPQTDEHLAGCLSCIMAHDKGLQDV